MQSKAYTIIREFSLLPLFMPGPGLVWVVAGDIVRHVRAAGDADVGVPLPRPLPRPLLRPLQVVVAHGPGKDGVAGDHQVVDGEGDQGAVVGGDTRRAQDLFVKGVNKFSRYLIYSWIIFTIFG